MSELPRGFDWSRINAAVVTIPRGRWTTYGDLAQLGGTAAVPVGQHLANEPNLENAYRVLGANGRPRPDFRWADLSDSRDVLDVLREDGVDFDDSGAANPSQRIAAAELASLIAVLDDEGVSDDGRALTELVGQHEWSWERYTSELGVREDRVATGRELVDLITEAIGERDLPWEPVFRKGYVAFQRSGQYNRLVI